MKVTINTANFERGIEALISKVLTGAKKATIAACEEIIQDSLNEVPRYTETLAMSASYRIHGSTKNFTATIGYGSDMDPMNPRTGLYASQYAVKVHEDLSATHTTGKAKFLEDPIRRYQGKFKNKAGSIIRSEIGG